MTRYDPDPILQQLKDFQRLTAEYVFLRMYRDPTPATRFLVADEVGLGKTLVAKGIIALALDHLWDQTDRIDVIYVCSNAAIARQNVNRLNVFGGKEFELATRLTLLPKQMKQLDRRRRGRSVNFVSFTPGTTFDLRSRGGTAEERVVLYKILAEPRMLGVDSDGLVNLLQCNVKRANWGNAINETGVKPADRIQIDPGLARSFRQAVTKDKALLKAMKKACSSFRTYRASIPASKHELRYDVIGRLRASLARTCIAALRPNLVILDEFQRFKDLLDGDDEAAHLARDLFDHGAAARGPVRPSQARVLLLSATPYRMLTLQHEQEDAHGDEHYEDFIRTLKFLIHEEGADDGEETTCIKQDVERFRRSLYALTGNDDRAVRRARAALQRRLVAVMCRTERVNMTRDRDAMLAEPPREAMIDGEDLEQARLIDRAAQAVGSRDPMEYWKSSPYLLNFLRGYELRDKLDAALLEPGDELLSLIGDSRSQLLSKAHINNYWRVRPRNARLRSLFADTLDKGLWKLLWMPPSLPYTRPGGAYARKRSITKVLLFSSWNVVPDAVAAITSYEAERRMVGDRRQRATYSEPRKVVEGGRRSTRKELRATHKPLLRFTRERRKKDRLTGMPALAWLYPSPTLATAVDPLKCVLEIGRGSPVESEVVIARIADRLERMIRLLKIRVDGRKKKVDESWYWVAPALLDARHRPGVRDWCTAADGWPGIGPGVDREAGEGFRDHVKLFVSVMDGHRRMGPQPEGLSRVLALVALGAPGVCALRALHRIAPLMSWQRPELLSAAARVSAGFRTLFNMPETIALLRGEESDRRYWQLALQHAVDGNLQALLDEQVHMLLESQGLRGATYARRVDGVSKALAESLSIRTARQQVDEFRTRPSAQRIDITPFSVRCRFALRFGELKNDQDKTVARADTVRLAFNSPFRPFVLASTSIGQEGLDFHTWCHAVVHWNLPSNPIDLEQREGRVHRYKGHAVRKNVARRFGLATLAHGWKRSGDPWDFLFEQAGEKEQRTSDIVPYWVYERGSDPAKVERRVPLIPFSREVERLDRLKRSLALYRLVFGQPRQEDLLAHLVDRMPESAAREAIQHWALSLVPPRAHDL